MSSDALHAHLATGATTVCRAWTLVRTDGAVLGFTDHDRDLTVAGVRCRADTGLTARALQQSTGLSVDNSEAVGALSASAITEADILAGRYDAAEVQAWLVNWQDPEQRVLQFSGSLGEIQRSGGGFRAELRGLSERLNQLQGEAYLPRCSAVLGDRRCRFDTKQPGYSVEVSVAAVEHGRMFDLPGLVGFDDDWFRSGRFEVLTGEAHGLIGLIKNDRLQANGRQVELWQAIGAPIANGDMVRLVAGCDKAATTCRSKFGNFLNFRGFPHIPGDDWLASYPLPDRPNTGGQRQPGTGAA
jgi:uncharacterized phage protein (TIGR02218 family)